MTLGVWILIAVGFACGPCALFCLILGLCRAAAWGDEQLARTRDDEREIRSHLYPLTGDVAASTREAPR